MPAKTEQGDKKSATTSTSTKTETSTSVNALKLLGLFVLWYAANAFYNVFNGHCKKDLELPYFNAAAQLAVGLVYAWPLWFLGLRKAPKLSVSDVVTIFPIVVLNTIGHVCAVKAMFEKGGASFTHVIKASEPVVSVILGILVNFDFPYPLTFLSLFPITYGVVYASTLGDISVEKMSKELTTNAAVYAMSSNVAFALRSIMRNKLSNEFKERTGLKDPSNEHAVTTSLSVCLALLLVSYTEPMPVIEQAFNSIKDQKAFLVNIFVCGMSFYLYNEYQNIVLGSLGPVPTAVGNTLKRVVIFVALYFFLPGETFPQAKTIGCVIAVLGCLAYAILNNKKL